MDYTIDYFIRKFSAIPEENWCIRARVKGDQRCAYGWCYPSKSIAGKSIIQGAVPVSDEERSLSILIKRLNPRWGAGGVNNGIYEKYQQPTPKQRILAALYDIKKLSKEPEVQECDYPDITKDLAVLPEERVEVDLIPVLK